MGDKTDVWQGTLALMVLKTIEALGPLHGYGIARRIEQTSGDRLSLKAKFYELTRAVRRQLERETRDCEKATEILARFLAPSKDLA